LSTDHAELDEAGFKTTQKHISLAKTLKVISGSGREWDGKEMN